MSLLDTYAVRIAKYLNVSLEGWWEDLFKQFFEDKQDSGEVDVWEEERLPDTMGVATTSWTELLSRTDEDMIQYMNYGGKSGVVEYDTGVDWFLVRFRDGSLYLYTEKSTAPEHIYQMRRLAETGSGLNSYLNRIVGNEYAGRNYKGVIAMAQGMESYQSKRALRALQLIIAHKNTLMQETISQEGIGEMFTRLKNFVQGKDEHGIKGDEKKPGAKLKSGDKWWSDEYRKEIEQIRDAIKRYYLNPTWLDKQKFVTGSVDGKGIAGPLNFDGKLGDNLLENVHKGIAWTLQKEKQWIDIVTPYDRQIQTIDTRVKKATTDSGNTDEKALDLVVKAIKEMQSLPEPKIPKDSSCGLGNRNLMFDKHGHVSAMVVKPLQTADKVKALTKEQVIEAAKLLLELLDFDNVYARFKTPGWLDHSDGDEFNDWLNDDHESVYFEYYEMDHHALDDKYVSCLFYLIDEPAVLGALEKLIDRSISGSVSNETISVEAFNQMESRAGKDGLSPQAQKALEITRKLVFPVAVSNEGIWGAVRYIFGGNYEDLPKINTAYDEATEAVNRTYGNPDWVRSRRLAKGKVKLKGFSQVGVMGPAKALEKVKQNNAKSLAKNTDTVKKEIEYLSKVAKAIQSGDKDKCKAILDMFEKDFKGEFEAAEQMDFGSSGEVDALSPEGLDKAAAIFDEAMKYRLQTDALYSGGFFKVFYTEGAERPRFGSDGVVTAKADGSVRELSIALGKRLHQIEDKYYSNVMSGWGNVDAVVKGTLLIMEASAG